MTLVTCHPPLNRSDLPPLNRCSAYVRLGRKLRGRTQTGSKLEWLGGAKAFDFKK